MRESNPRPLNLQLPQNLNGDELSMFLKLCKLSSTGMLEEEEPTRLVAKQAEEFPQVLASGHNYNTPFIEPINNYL